MAVSGKLLIRSAVSSLNDRAEQLGMVRRFEFKEGNRTMGRQHALLEVDKDLQHPVSETKIGASIADAQTYLAAMNQALLAVLRDQDFRRAQQAQPAYAELPPDVPTPPSGHQQFGSPPLNFRDGHPIF